ncbi:MAG: PepSY domain-containing protein [Pseudomonadota bacterium]
MKHVVLGLAAAAIALPAFASDTPTEEELATINAMLAGMNCEVDDDDIEKEDDGGFELDDVICADGKQYDIDLNKEFQIIEQRAE